MQYKMSFDLRNSVCRPLLHVIATAYGVLCHLLRASSLHKGPVFILRETVCVFKNYKYWVDVKLKAMPVYFQIVEAC